MNLSPLLRSSLVDMVDEALQDYTTGEEIVDMVLNFLDEADEGQDEDEE